MPWDLIFLCEISRLQFIISTIPPLSGPLNGKYMYLNPAIMLPINLLQK